MKNLKVFGIGQPLIDILANATDEEILSLGLKKGFMNPLDAEGRKKLNSFLKKKNDVLYSCGGSCSNTMATLSAVGVKTAFCGKVGKDRFAQIYAEKLEEANVVNHLISSEDNETGFSIILISPDSERTMNTYLGNNISFGPADIKTNLFNGYDILHFTGYIWNSEKQKKQVTKALEAAKKLNMKISFDVADRLLIENDRESFLGVIEKYCDIVFANQEEAEALFKTSDLKNCCENLGRLCEIAVVKRGKDGSFATKDNLLYDIPAYKIKQLPVDTTGAGDTYASGFLYGICNGLPIDKCGEIASFLAANIVVQKGAQFSKEKASLLRTMLETKYLN